MTLYQYLKDEFMLNGTIQIDDTEDSNPSHFGDFRYNSYYGRIIEDVEKIKEEDIKRAWFFPQYLSFGDYDHSCHVERSNKAVFIEEYGDIEGVKEIWGGYGSEGIIIRLDTECDEFIEVLEALEDYPVIDEDHCSQLEYDMIEEAWEDFGRDDMQKELEKRYTLKYNPDEVRRRGNESGGNEFIEAGGIVYFDIDAMIEEHAKSCYDNKDKIFNN